MGGGREGCVRVPAWKGISGLEGVFRRKWATGGAVIHNSHGSVLCTVLKCDLFSSVPWLVEQPNGAYWRNT